MNKYKHLREYYEHWSDFNYEPEHSNCFPNLIIWFREAINNDYDEAARLLNMDDDEAEEFASWGSNSRWNHVARPIMESWFECDRKSFCDMLVSVADKYGDPDVETKYFNKKDEQNGQ